CRHAWGFGVAVPCPARRASAHQAARGVRLQLDDAGVVGTHLQREGKHLRTTLLSCCAVARRTDDARQVPTHPRSHHRRGRRGVVSAGASSISPATTPVATLALLPKWNYDRIECPERRSSECGPIPTSRKTENFCAWEGQGHPRRHQSENHPLGRVLAL